MNSWTALLYTFGFAAVLLLVVNLLAPAPVAGIHSTSPDLLWLGENVAGWGLLFLLAAGPMAGG